METLFGKKKKSEEEERKRNKKTTSIVFSKELSEKIAEISYKVFRGEYSRSFIVRELIKKGIEFYSEQIKKEKIEKIILNDEINEETIKEIGQVIKIAKLENNEKIVFLERK